MIDKKYRFLAAVALALFGAMFGATKSANAQDAVATQPRAPTIIRGLAVEGNQRVDAENILPYLAIGPGEAYDSEKIDLSLKALFATGIFSDVQFEQRGDILVVKVVENPTINQVLFEGQKSLTTEKLTKEVQIKPRSWFSVGRVQADRRRLIEVYRRSGNFAALIVPKIRELPQNRVDLIFEIQEGPKTGIRNINFIGNREFSDRRLMGVIATEESSWWRFFSSKDNYDPDKLEYDREQISKFYLNNGFYDFRVNAAIAELTPDQKDFFVTFSLDEGEKYEFGDVTVNAQLSRLSPEALKAVVPIRHGAVYERDSIEKAIEAITFAAGAAGYAFVEVRHREVPNHDTNVVDLYFEVDEGPRVYIDRIDIIGNSTTLDHVIRRELRLSEGDAFNRVLMDSSRNRIRALGFFKDVSVEERRTALPDRTVLEIKLQEQSTGELAFSLGYSSAEAYQFDVSVTQRNLRGRGQFLRFRVAASSFSKNVDIRFTEPRFLGRNMAAGVDIFSVETNYLQYGNFIQTSTGVGLRVGFPLAEDRNLGLHYTYRTDTVDVPRTDCFDALGAPLPIQAPPQQKSRSPLCAAVGSNVTSLLGYTFNWDRRNDPVHPTRGFNLSLSQDVAGLGVGVQYHRTELNGAAYRGIFPGWVASAKLSAGYIDGWGGDNVRISDRFFKGGQTFRGFEIAGIGPRIRQISTALDGSNPETLYGDALGGKAFVIGSLELTVPTPLPDSYGITASLFVDAGTLGLLDDADRINSRVVTQPSIDSQGQAIPGGILEQTTFDDLSLRASAGLSVFWTSPFGPVRFDFSYPLKNEPYDKTENFKFSTSTQF